MDALKPQELIPALGLLAAGYVILPAALIATVTDTEPRTLRCPETNRNVLVRLDAKRVIKSMFTSAPPKIGMCTRWPERQGCDQGCVWQL
jgi:hypothetical protein